jgi:hypothetical protein
VAITLIVATNLITQSASAFKSNGENIECVHPDSGTYKLHNYDITTKQNDCYRTSLDHHFHMIIARTHISVSTNSEVTPLNYLFHEFIWISLTDHN